MLITVFWCMQRCHLSCPSTFNLSTMAIWAKDKAGQRQLQARLKAVVEWSCAQQMCWLFYIGSILPIFVRDCFILLDVWFLYLLILCLDNLHLWSYEYSIIDIKRCALWDMIVMLVLFQCQVANVGQILVMLLGRWLDANQGCINMYIWYTVFVFYLHHIIYVLSVTIIYYIRIYRISHAYLYIWYL